MENIDILLEFIESEIAKFNFNLLCNFVLTLYS